MTFGTAVYTWQQRLFMQQNTCFWERGQHGDTVFKCTRELAVCELSPYLFKSDNSDRAQHMRRKACEQLVRSDPYSLCSHNNQANVLDSKCPTRLYYFLVYRYCT